MRNMARWGLPTGLVGMLLVSGALAQESSSGAASESGAQAPLSPWVDDAGAISFPENFRTDMIHLGSWFVPEGDASGFHGVYTQPGTIEAFRESGAFPDGTVLVKELRAHASGNYTTGAGVSYETPQLKQWFVMIKDSTDRFADSNPVWGDGWGWALFTTDDTSTNAATDYETDCLGCHIPAKDNDWIYTEGYPILVE